MGERHMRRRTRTMAAAWAFAAAGWAGGLFAGRLDAQEQPAASPAAVAPAPAVSVAAPAAKPRRILFVGNSFTHAHYSPARLYNTAAVTDENHGLPPDSPRANKRAADNPPFSGVAGVFKKLTDEAGLPYEVHLEVISGKTLEYHYKHALPVIAQPGWDAVVLQGYSTESLPEVRSGKAGDQPRTEAGPVATATPAPEAGTSPAPTTEPTPTPVPAEDPRIPSKQESFLRHTVLLEQAIHGASPDAKVYLYATWPCANNVYPERAMYAGESIDAMGADLHDGYGRAAAEDGHCAGVAPVGDAWLRAIHEGVARENPYKDGPEDRLDLWGADRKHPSGAGAYLAALVIFQQITGHDARALGRDEEAAAALKISPENAVRLQQVAFDQVTSSAAQAAAAVVK